MHIRKLSSLLELAGPCVETTTESVELVPKLVVIFITHWIAIPVRLKATHGDGFIVACTTLRLTKWFFFFEFRNCLRIPIDTVLEECLEPVDGSHRSFAASSPPVQNGSDSGAPTADVCPTTFYENDASIIELNRLT